MNEISKLISEENEKNVSSLSSAEFVQSMVGVKDERFQIHRKNTEIFYPPPLNDYIVSQT